MLAEMKPHARIIVNLGGASAVARMLRALGTSITVRAVATWLATGRIPARYHEDLLQAAEDHGKSLHPSDFFQEKWAHGTSEWRRQRSQPEAEATPQHRA